VVAETVTSEPAGSAEEIDIDLTAIFEAVRREATAALPGAHSAVGAFLKLVMIGLLRTRALRVAGEASAAARSSLMRRFRRSVEANFRQHWPVARYAEELGITADRLHAICSQEMGQPPKTLIHERLMLEAKRSLVYTNLTIAEIASDLGFNDTAYFSRFFAKRAGVSAVAYRRARSPTGSQ
jgi:AraC family transcriptional activator of pobA